MSYSPNYTQDEMATLLLAPIEAGVAVLLSSKSGLKGSAQEVFTLYNTTNQKVAQQYPNNSLIQEVLTGNHKEADKQVSQQVNLYLKDEKARQHAREDALEMCHKAATLLNQKASPQEAQEYKNWVVDVSSQVAKAASEQGQQVSPAETATIGEIRQALHIMPS